MVPDEREDKRKWVGVRISKAMMHQVEDVIRDHPEYAWNTPNDFIRDATRRYMEHIHQQEALRKEAMAGMPGRVEGVLEEALGESFTKEFEAVLDKRTGGLDPVKDAEAYVAALDVTLAEYFGPTVARLVTQRMGKASEAVKEGEGR
jgi:hypothetical protein